MLYLLIASVLWAPSFGLIKHYLAGVDSNFVAWIRLLISACVFLWFVRPRAVTLRLGGKLLGLGAVQFGLMYMSYTYAFRFLPGHLVALFTIFTPLYVALFNDLLERRFHQLFLLTALLAVAGSAVIVYTDSGGPALRRTLIGFVVVQASNLCFAVGQVGYRRLMPRDGALKDRDVFGWMYVGATLVTTIPAALTTGGLHVHLTNPQIVTLLYLGVVPSGLAFFLWNIGATRANAGTLAVFNNAKIPLGMLCAVLFFSEHVQSPWRLAVGAGVIIAAVIVNERCGKARERDDVPGID